MDATTSSCATFTSSRRKSGFEHGLERQHVLDPAAPGERRNEVRAGFVGPSLHREARALGDVENFLARVARCDGHLLWVEQWPLVQPRASGPQKARDRPDERR